MDSWSRHFYFVQNIFRFRYKIKSRYYFISQYSILSSLMIVLYGIFFGLTKFPAKKEVSCQGGGIKI